jgi:multidrug efflux pump subunit AcrA (membrane-fusion protein)
MSIALIMILAGAVCVLVRGIIANNKDQAVGDYDLIPGQYAPVRLTVGQDPAALLIPQPALVESQIGKQVFVVDQDNKVESRSVEVGRGYQGQWVIEKGLKKGEKANYIRTIKTNQQRRIS